MAFIEEVKSLLPGFGYAAGREKWRNFEARLPIVFPDDFKEFLDEYGPGWLDSRIWFYAPGAEKMNLEDFIDDSIKAWAEIWKQHPGYVPYSAGTHVGALLPWGSTSDGMVLFFHVRSLDPSTWTVFVYCDFEYEESGLPFGEWLLRFLHGGEDQGNFVRNRAGGEEDDDDEPMQYCSALA